jgi:hypothetical protein
MTLSARWVAALALLYLVGTPKAALADPISIASGHIDVINPGTGAATFHLVGDGFDISGTSTDGLATAGCSPCVPGSYSPAVGISEGIVSGSVGAQSFTNLAIGGFFQLGGSVTVPTTASRPTTVTFPFVVLPGSFLNGFKDLNLDTETKVFRLDLRGGGTGTLQLTPMGNAGAPLFNPSALSFDFGGSSPSPTPEPSTVILFGVGLVGIAYHQRLLSKKDERSR